MVEGDFNVKLVTSIFYCAAHASVNIVNSCVYAPTTFCRFRFHLRSENHVYLKPIQFNTMSSTFVSTEECVLLCIIKYENLFQIKMFVSLLWEYFVKADGGTASCKICLKNLQTKSGNTSSLRKHLKNVYKEKYKAVVEAEDIRKKKDDEEKSKKRHITHDDEGSSKTKQPKIGDFTDKTKYPTTSDKQKQFDQAMVEFLADTFVPFNVTAQDSFKKLFI